MQARKQDHIYAKDEKVVLAVKVWYRTKRPDLDISLIQDLLEGKDVELEAYAKKLVDLRKDIEDEMSARIRD